MSQKQAPATQLLSPILDMYKDAPVAVLGCRSTGIHRASCEFDVLVVSQELRPPVSAKVGGTHVDVVFVPESEAMKPSVPEHAVSMAKAASVRDSSLTLSTSISACLAVFQDSCRRSTRSRLSAALKSLGRADDALAKGSPTEADFWLLSAGYDFAKAWLYSQETIPSPSHLVSQLRGVSAAIPSGFAAFSSAAGLDSSSKVTVTRRLEGVSVLHDALRGRGRSSTGATGSWSAARLDVVKSKTSELELAQDHVEAYCFLGVETVEAIGNLSSPPARKRKGARELSPLARVMTGQEKLLGDRILRELGLARNKKTVEESLRGLKDQISGLSKRI